MAFYCFVILVVDFYLPRKHRRASNQEPIIQAKEINNYLKFEKIDDWNVETIRCQNYYQTLASLVMTRREMVVPS